MSKSLKDSYYVFLLENRRKKNSLFYKAVKADRIKLSKTIRQDTVMDEKL